MSTHRARHVEQLTVSSRGDGAHRVLKAEVGGRAVVIKLYGLKRSRLEAAVRQFGSLVLVGKSSISAADRCRTERETLELWRREGFDVPGEVALDRAVLSDIGLKGSHPWLALNWVSGPIMGKMVMRDDLSLSRKEEIVAEFTKVCAARHARAIELDEPRLLCEHPTFEHVILSEGRFVFIDFEIVFTGRCRLETLIARELAGFVRSLHRMADGHLGPLLSAMVAAYPNRSRFEKVRNDFERFGAVPVFDWIRSLPLAGGLARIIRGDKHDLRQKIVAELDRALEAGR